MKPTLQTPDVTGLVGGNGQAVADGVEQDRAAQNLLDVRMDLASTQRTRSSQDFEHCLADHAGSQS
jgi:hypothetical protein